MDDDDYDGSSGPYHPRTIALGLACWAIIIAALYALADWVVPIPVGMAG